MNIFFATKQDYLLNDTVDNVRNQIEKITHRKWSDFSENITGKLSDDNSFTLTHIWSFAIIRWLERNPAYLSGTISKEGNKTKLSISLRPNSLFIIFFYLLTIIFFGELFGIIRLIKGIRPFELLFFPLFNFILFGIMQTFTKGLKKRFERLLHLG